MSKLNKDNKIYFNYKKWECFQLGMYETTCFLDEETMIRDCLSTLRCECWLEECMRFVMYNWKHSIQQHLSNIHRNRQAFLGQAACCWAHGAPEYITKKAWARLTEREQRLANKIADQVIDDWENVYLKGKYIL